MVKSMAAEMEMDGIAADGRMTGSNLRGYPLESGWHSPPDGTTGVEITSPIWSTVRQASDSIRRQFTNWIRENNICPLLQNGHGLHSSGAHIHIGKGRSAYLDAEEIARYGKHVRVFLPMITAISAAPLPSRRGQTSTYCQSISNYRWNFATDHYAELSWSQEHGTAEIRIPDPNIPQVILTNIWILGNVMEHSNEDCHCSTDALRFDNDEYSRLRSEALNHGVTGIPIARMLRSVRQFMGNRANDFEVNSVKEVLFMAAKYYSSPHQIYTMLRPNLYEYMKTMLENPSEYLTNLSELTTGVENRQRVSEWFNEASRIHSLDEMITLAEAGMRGLQARMPAPPVVLATATFSLGRSDVQRAVQDRAFNVTRITDVPGFTVEQIRAKISYLLSRHGDGFTNPVDEEQVQTLPTRFYVFIAPAGNRWDIAGCIGINVGQRARAAHDSEVGHLAVHRMYRRLGIAKILVNHVKAIALENGQTIMHTHIKIGNIPSEQLFAGAGYRIAAVDVDRPEPAVPQGSRKWILSLAPQVQGMGTQPPAAPGPATPTPEPERSVAPTHGAFASTPTRGQTTLEELVRQMRYEEEQARQALHGDEP